MKALKMPDIKARLDELGLDSVGNSPEQFAEQIKVEVAKYGKVIREANIKPE